MTEEKTPNVGYRNPPKDTRFKKGKSGNPRGRPRKRKDLNTVLQQVLNRRVTVKGSETKMAVREALIRKLKDYALQGDKQTLALQRRILTDAGYDEPDARSFAEEQMKLLKAIEEFPDLRDAKEDVDDG
jgi:hypothetical protein